MLVFADSCQVPVLVGGIAPVLALVAVLRLAEHEHLHLQQHDADNKDGREHLSRPRRPGLARAQQLTNLDGAESAGLQHG